MSEKISKDDDFEETDDLLDGDDFDDIEDSLFSVSNAGAARRRLEQIREERELERLLYGDFL